MGVKQRWEKRRDRKKIAEFLGEQFALSDEVKRQLIHVGHYLATGNCPLGHKLHRVRPAPTPTAPVPVAKPPRQPKSAAPAALKPTHQLVTDIVDAGGILERNVATEGASRSVMRCCASCATYP